MGRSPALVRNYPLATVAFSGTADAVAAQFKAAAARLFLLSDTANILLQQDGERVTLAYVHRSKAREMVAGPLQSRAGFLEVGGILLLKRPSDIELISTTSNRFELIWQALASLEPEGIRESLAAWLRDEWDGNLSLAE
jgi:hypothetical protein